MSEKKLIESTDELLPVAMLRDGLVNIAPELNFPTFEITPARNGDGELLGYYIEPLIGSRPAEVKIEPMDGLSQAD